MVTDGESRVTVVGRSPRGHEGGKKSRAEPEAPGNKPKRSDREEVGGAERGGQDDRWGQDDQRKQGDIEETASRGLV